MKIYCVILYLSQVVKLSFISICYGYCSMYVLALVVSFIGVVRDNEITSRLDHMGTWRYAAARMPYWRSKLTMGALKTETPIELVLFEDLIDCVLSNDLFIYLFLIFKPPDRSGPVSHQRVCENIWNETNMNHAIVIRFWSRLISSYSTTLAPPTKIFRTLTFEMGKSAWGNWNTKMEMMIILLYWIKNHFMEKIL